MITKITDDNKWCRSFRFDSYSLNKITNESQNNFAIEIVCRYRKPKNWKFWIKDLHWIALSHTISIPIVYLSPDIPYNGVRACCVFHWIYFPPNRKCFENAFASEFSQKRTEIFDFIMAVEKFLWNNQHHNNNSFENSVWLSDSYTVFRVHFFFPFFFPSLVVVIVFVSRNITCT